MIRLVEDIDAREEAEAEERRARHAKAAEWMREYEAGRARQVKAIVKFVAFGMLFLAVLTALSLVHCSDAVARMVRADAGRVVRPNGVSAAGVNSIEVSP